MYPNQNLIDELIRRIVGTVQPLRIVLFSSAARGEMRPDSDIDVLIVMPEEAIDDAPHRTSISSYLDFHCRLTCLLRLQRIFENTKITSVSCITGLCGKGRKFMPPDPVSPGSSEDWLQYAKADLALAQVPLPAGSLPAGSYMNCCAFMAGKLRKRASKQC